MDEIYPIKNALISVFHKEGIRELARTLCQAGVVIYASSGTAKYLLEEKIPVIDLADYINFPPLFKHRVVTLHPKIHGGILHQRENKADLEEAIAYGIISFDLVVVNLYPVEEAISSFNYEQVIEKTDIGGVALIRAAAKNHKYVTIVVDSADYLPVAELIAKNKGLNLKNRMKLAGKAFRLTADYDQKISAFYQRKLVTLK